MKRYKDKEIVTCHVCNGTGFVPEDYEGDLFLAECPVCEGDCIIEIEHIQYQGENLRVLRDSYRVK